MFIVQSVYLYNLYFFYYIFITPVHNLPLMARQLGIICFTPVNNLPPRVRQLNIFFITHENKLPLMSRQLDNCFITPLNNLPLRARQLDNFLLYTSVTKIWFFFWYRIHVEQRVINDNTCSISTDIL